MSNEMSSAWLQSFKSHILASNGGGSKTVCVTSGKGGVGKTTIALKLALELSHFGKKILLIDCDHNLSNTAIKVGLPVTDNFAKLVSGEIKFEDALYRNGNFHLLSGCNGNIHIFSGGHNFEEYLSQTIKDQQGFYDYIVLDSPAGITAHTVFLASFCDERIFILNPDRSSITDAYSLMKIIKNTCGIKENCLVVNKVQDRRQFNRVIETVSKTANDYLNVRSCILGFVTFSGINHDEFDQKFFNRKKNLINKNFLMILDKFLDKVDGAGPLGGRFFQQCA